MRYGRNHKAETRARIVDIAAARFRRDGVNGVGIQSLMADAGLTHGGFYAHFPSKDHLVAEAVRAGFEQTAAFLARMVAEAAPAERFRAFLDAYLSEQHRAHMERGCVGAALAPELARMGPAVKGSFKAGLLRIVDLIADILPDGGTPDARRDRALTIFAMLMGAVQLARTVDDPDLAAAALAGAREQAFSAAAMPWGR